MAITSGLHKDATGINIHVPYAFLYSNQTDRLTGTGTSATDVGKFARQSDNNTIWMLTDDSPVTWIAVSSTGSVAGGGASTGTVGDLSDFIYVRKSTTEIVHDSTVFQDDDELTFAVGANDIWEVEYVLMLNGAVNADMKFAITYPTGGALDVFNFGPSSGFAQDAAEGDLRIQGFPAVASGSLCALFGCNMGGAGNSPLCAILKALYIGGVNAGNIVLQWAQYSSADFDNKVYAGSYLIARKIG